MSNIPDSTVFTKTTVYVDNDGKVTNVFINHYKTATLLCESVLPKDLESKYIQYTFHKTEVYSYGIYTKSLELKVIFDTAIEDLKKNKHICCESVVGS